MIVFDIEAAFPSIAHDYVFQALAADGLPEAFINLVKAFYVDHYVTVVFAGRRFEGFPIHSGIKQGCALLGSPFALALDPFIRFVLTKIPRR